MTQHFFKIIYLRHEGSMIGVQCQLLICRGPFLATKRHLLRIFAIYGLRSRHREFFDGPLYVLYLGWEVKNDVSGQSQDVLRVCNVNIRKSLLGQKQSTCSWLFRLVAPSVKWSEFFFMALLLTINPAVAKRFWLIPSTFRWVHGCILNLHGSFGTGHNNA